MGGFLGIGGSSAKTDRGAELSARGGLFDIFNYGLGSGKTGESTGQSTLNQPAAYWQSLLQPGRTQATTNAAPAINTALDQADAARRQAGAMGTSRTGGTAAINSNAGATTQKTIDDMINQNLQTGRSEAAKGLAGIGSTELQNALNLLGLSGKSASDIMNEGQSGYEWKTGIDMSTGMAAGSALANIASTALFAA